MKRIILFSFFVAISIATQAQSPNGVYVNLEENKAYIEILVDTNGVIQLKDSLNGVMTFTFSDSNNLSWRIKFNDDKKPFYVGFNCEGDSCVNVQNGDLKNGRLKLTFATNTLIGVGDRLIKARAIIGSKPYVKIIKNKVEKPKDMYDDLKVEESKTPQLALSLENSKLLEYDFYCGLIKCKDCDTSGIDDIKRRKYDLFYKVFEKRKFFYENSTGKGVTPKYWVVYDNRDGKKMIPYYFKIHNSWEGNFLTTKTRLYPQANRQTVFTILGPADTSFYDVDGLAVTHFMENESEVAKALTGLSSGKAAGDATTEKKAESGEDLETKFSETIGEEVLVSAIKTKIPPALEQKMKKDPALKTAIDNILKRYNAALEKIKQVEKQKENLEDELDKVKKEKEALKNNIALCTDTIKILNDSLRVFKKEIEEITKLTSSIGQVEDLGEKLLALERDMEKFNVEYADISFFEQQYKIALLCLQLKIKEYLNIPAPPNAKDLAQYLINLVKTADKSKRFYIAFGNLIKQIELQYKDALSKKPKFSLFSTSKKIPNADEFVTRFKTPKGAAPFFSDSFNISGGLKIDFSTGVYLTGLANSIYILAPHQFQYKETRDTILPNGNIDNIFTGRIIDTSGNLIQENQPKYSYSTGFLFHIYPRTGGYVNWGLAGGVTITNSNSSPLQLMLGISTMFNSGKSRISLSGGIVWGQVKTISTVAQGYSWNASKDPDNRIYDSRNDLPLFYKASSDIPTYDQWKHSFFFGLSYNFASVNVGK